MDKIGCYIVHQNICSLRKDFGRLVAELSVLDECPEIVVLSGILIGDNDATFYKLY